uniref:Peptidase M13 C-terminal domain-containing protein n=1 Tax=Strongyloides stercoralis TaxID=6248 RepID=A0A913HS46_STRER
MRFVLNLLFSYFLLLKLECEGCLPMKNLRINITFNEDSINIDYDFGNVSKKVSKIPETKETTGYYQIETTSEKSVSMESLKKINLEKATKSLSEFVDKSVDPCDDFYEFTCGTFTKNNPSPDNKTLVGPIVGNYNDYIDFVKNILSNKKYSKSEALNKIKKLFYKCMPFKEYEKNQCITYVFILGQYFFTSAYLNEMVNNKEIEKKYDDVQIMIDKILNEYGLLLLYEKDDILDDKTKLNYMIKIRKMKFSRDALRYLYNISNTEECYKHLNFSDDYSVSRIIMSVIVGKISMPKDKKGGLYSCSDFFLQTDFLSSVIDINAIHYYGENSIIIFPKFLAEPFYDINYPKVLNYGSIGFIIGHEIVHGYDIYGIHFDHDGKIDRNMTSNYTKTHIENRYNCFLKQYNNQTNSTYTRRYSLNQIVADNGGIKIAHRAYMKYLKNSAESEIKIPGFEEYTNEQLFFISFSKTLCMSVPDVLDSNNKTRPMKNVLKNRVMNTLSNYKPFSKAFNCKIGSKMNPVDKCELWLN